MRILASISISCLIVFGAHDAVTAGTVFAVDGTNHDIVEFDAATGTVLNVLPAPDLASGGPDGLAASGSSLYFVNGNGSNVIHEIDASSGASLGAFPAPMLAGGTDGLAFMDDVLYTLDGGADTIFMVDPATDGVMGSCSTGAFAVGGLAAEDGRLFAVAGLTSIVELDSQSCAVVGGPFAAPAGDFFLGLAFDGTHLFASTWLGQAVLTMDPDTGAVLDSFQPGFAASGLASTAAAPTRSVVVELDFKPTQCLNPFNLKNHAAVKVLLLGSDVVDVGQVDLDSLRLEGVAPFQTKYRDVGTPGVCDRVDSDGHLDLVMKFDAGELASALGDRGTPMAHNLSVTVELEGALLDGTPLSGTAEIVLRKKAWDGPSDTGSEVTRGGRTFSR